MIKEKHKEKKNIRKELKEHNTNWPQISDHPHRILIIGGSGSGKTHLLFDLINHQPDIDITYLYAKDLNEVKYKFLIKKREAVGTKLFFNTQMIWMLFIKTLKNTT